MPWLVRRWFLLLLLVGLSLAACFPRLLQPFTTRVPLRLVVGLSLFLVAWNLEGRRLWLAFRRPGCVAWGLAISYAWLPALAVPLGWFLPGADLRLGLLIIASVPCTLSSAVLWTRQAGGDEAMALVVVMLTSVSGWLLTPLWLTGAGPVAVALDTSAMMEQLALVLVLPVLLGQLARCPPGAAALAARHRVACGNVSRLLVTTVLICAAVEASLQSDQLSLDQLVRTLLVCVVLHLAGVCLGLLGGRLFGIGLHDRIAIGFAGSQKTLPVGLFLFGTYYHEYPLAVLPLLFYHAGQLLLDTIIAGHLADETSGEHEDPR